MSEIVILFKKSANPQEVTALQEALAEKAAVILERDDDVGAFRIQYDGDLQEIETLPNVERVGVSVRAKTFG